MHHLVSGAVPFLEKGCIEAVGHLVDHGCLPARKRAPVVTPQRQDGFHIKMDAVAMKSGDLLSMIARGGFPIFLEQGILHLFQVSPHGLPGHCPVACFDGVENVAMACE